MTKRDSLRFLVANTTLFNEEMKERLLRQVDYMSDEDVQSLGFLLAIEKETAIQSFQSEISRVDEILAQLEKIPEEAAA